MKTKNNLITGILIGIGMIVIPLIIMGFSSVTADPYTQSQGQYLPVLKDGNIYKFDTQTGNYKKSNLYY